MKTSDLPLINDFTDEDYLVADNTNIATRRISGSELKKYIKKGTAKRYGYRVELTNSDTATRVEYIYDAEGMEPALMNYAGDMFDYGDWGDKWFVQKNFPCILSPDGEILYRLDPDNYAKTVDGAAAPITDSAGTVNCMSAIPCVWYKRYTDGNYRYFVCCEEQYDDTYYADVHLLPDGTAGDYKMMAMYDCAVLDNKVRSISGVAPGVSTSPTTNLTQCQANGENWLPHEWNAHCLIYDLLVLMSKSTDLRTKFGYGNVTGSTILNSGTMNTTGQFWGYADNTKAVKVFHMENLWGNVDRWLGGLWSNYAQPRCAGNVGPWGNEIYDLTSGRLGMYRTLPYGAKTASVHTGYISNFETCRWGYVPILGGSVGTGECGWYNSYTQSYQVDEGAYEYNYIVGHDVWVAKWVTYYYHLDHFSDVYAAVGGNCSLDTPGKSGMMRLRFDKLSTGTDGYIGTGLCYRHAIKE